MTEASLKDLIDKHHALEAELSDAMAHPAASDEEIAAIKRKKLLLKDQIAAAERHRAA